MKTIKHFKKYLFLIAIIGFLVVFTGCQDDIVPPTTVSVTGITVTGAGNATSVTNGQTLQMSKTVAPTGATNKDVTWSVINGTGTATINTTGLLTATGVGKVTVKAVAKDGSGIFGIKEITVTEATLPTSPLASFTAVTLTQTGDVANSNVQYADAAVVIAALPTEIEVTLVDATKKMIPLTWTDTDTYNAAVAADYTFTATWGAMPAGANNANSLMAPTVELTVAAGVLAVSPLASFTAVTLTQTGDVANSNVQYANAAAVIAALPTEIEVTLDNATKKMVPLTWADTDTYDAAVAADYTFTATWGAMPAGANNANSLMAPTVELTVAAGIAPPLSRVDLKSAENFVILAKTGITTTGATAITGDLGISPGLLGAMTGFGETLAVDGTHATSSLVTGKIYAAGMDIPTPTMLTAAILDMEDAYAAIMALTNPKAGTIAGGETLTPGLYKSTPAVNIATNLTLDGEGKVDPIWVFQITGAFNLDAGIEIVLTNGAKAENVFWQVKGAVSLLAGSKMKGIILGEDVIALTAGASIDGKLLGQTNVTLIGNTVVDQPPIL